MPSSEQYTETARSILDRVVEGQAEGVRKAAGLITDALRNDGVVQAFGTGHSEALATEISGRAGGLVPTNKIAMRDLVLYGDEPRELLGDPALERDPDTARRLYGLTAPHPRDAFVIASNSGINGCVVEMARLVKEHGHPLIAVTSLEHTAGVTSRHPSGQRLSEIADVVLDNGAPCGDAVLEMSSGGTACAISSVTGAMLAQMMTAEVIRMLEEAGQTPPVYLSANLPGGDEHNRVLEARYTGRIRRSA